MATRVFAQNYADGRDVRFSFTIPQNGGLENNYFQYIIIITFQHQMLILFLFYIL
jgi:hypothetical protein